MTSTISDCSTKLEFDCPFCGARCHATIEIDDVDRTAVVNASSSHPEPACSGFRRFAEASDRIAYDDAEVVGRKEKSE